MDFLTKIETSQKSDVKYFQKSIREDFEESKKHYTRKFIIRHCLFIGEFRIYIKCFYVRYGCVCCGSPFHISSAKIQFHKGIVSDKNEPFFVAKLIRDDKKDNKFKNFDLLYFLQSKIGKTDFDFDFQKIISQLSCS